MIKPMNKLRKKTMKQQLGLTMISWMVVIVFLLFQGVIAMNVIPVYLTDSSVKSVMENLPGDPEASKATAKVLKTMIVKRLSINSVYTVKAEHIKIKKQRSEYVVTIDYEPRGKLIGSLDYIVTFHHEARIPTR